MPTDVSAARENAIAPRGKRVRLTVIDWIGMAVASAIFLLISFLHSRHTIFWSDEIMGWLVLREPDFAHLLHSWWAGADSSGIFFYILGRPWLALFGASSLSLRLFTATGIAAACCLLWACARQFYSSGVVAAVLPLTLLAHPVLIWQLANGRTYGLLLASLALVAYAFAITDPDRPLTTRLLLLTFVAHLLLVGSHILGPLYSGVFLAGLIVRDLLQREVRLKLYLAGLAGWLGLLLSYRNLLATAALGKPAFWTLKPHFADLLLGFSAGNRPIRKTVVLLSLFALLTILRARGARQPAALSPRELVTRFTLIGSFYTCVLVIFLLSQVTTSVFVDRYLLPVLLGDALLLCEAITCIFAGWAVPLRLRQLSFALPMVVLGFVIRRELPVLPMGLPQMNYTGHLLSLIPPGVPAVITHPGIFAEMAFYRNGDATYLTPIDWPVTLDPASSPGYVSGTHEMENWKELGYFSSQIQPTATILANNPRFLVIAQQNQAVWFERRVLSSPEFITQDLGVHTEAVTDLHLWLVQRR